MDLACKNMPGDGKVEANLMSDWETVVDDEQYNDANCDNETVR